MYYSSSLRMFQKWNQWTIEIMARPRKTEALLTTLNFEFWISYFLMFSRLEAHIQFRTLNFQAFLYLIVLTCLCSCALKRIQLWTLNFEFSCDMFSMFSRPEAHIVIHEVSVTRLLENYSSPFFPLGFFRSLTRVIEASMYILNTGLRVQAFRKKEMMWGSGPDHVCHTSWRGVWPAPTISCIYLPDLRRSAISFVYDDPVLFVIDHVSMSLYVCIYCIFEPCIHRARHAYHFLIAVPYSIIPFGM